VVQEFYASMRSYDFLEGSPVKVRGKQVRFTAEDINRRWETRSFPQWAEGYAYRDIYQLYNRELATAIRSEGAQYPWSTTNKFVQGHLDFQSAFWHTFFSYSLLPSHHRHTVTLEPAILLYLMKMDIPFDVGTVALRRISEAGRTNTPNMAFPCLITHFCEIAEVPFRPGDRWETSRLVGTKAYNEAAIPRGIPILESEQSRKRRLQREQRKARKTGLAEEQAGGSRTEPGTSSAAPLPQSTTTPAEASECVPRWGRRLTRVVKDLLAEFRAFRDRFGDDGTYQGGPPQQRKRSRAELTSSSDSEPHYTPPPPDYHPGPSTAGTTSRSPPYDPAAADEFQTMSPFSPTALIPYPTPIRVHKPPHEGSDPDATDSATASD
jgi:hypothetical protein